ncbi:hypothetical protein K0A97_03415 [Patescibacteria group bacterium]|nr:hypothetical protein [Patescibacteria group bacterium]
MERGDRFGRLSRTRRTPTNLQRRSPRINPSSRPSPQELPLKGRDILFLNKILKATINSYLKFKDSYLKDNIEDSKRFKEILIWEQKKIREVLEKKS